MRFSPRFQVESDCAVLTAYRKQMPRSTRTCDDAPTAIVMGRTPEAPHSAKSTRKGDPRTRTSPRVATRWLAYESSVLG